MNIKFKKRIKQTIINHYLTAAVHYGHITTDWNPKMAPYLADAKYGAYFFDLFKTHKLLHVAGNVLQSCAQYGGQVLFVGITPHLSSLVSWYAKKCKSYYLTSQWLPGTLTNLNILQSKITKTLNLNKISLPKNTLLLEKIKMSAQHRRLLKFNQAVSGIQNMSALPNVVIFSDETTHSEGIYECKKLGIPTIAIVDSNSNPELITYPIPANDNSILSINFILNFLTNSIISGQAIKLCQA
jgi:small subunit ribosomal protein S2